jgi:hypothetical protein
MSKSNVVPKDKTMKELLLEAGSVPCHCSEFIEINKRGMVEIGAMDDFDYEIFWDCMRIYEAFGINYFSQYIYLCKGFYGNFTQGIEAWFNSPSIMGYRPDAETFLELVDVLRFFGISSYYGIDFSEYENACQQANRLYRMAKDNEMQRFREKGEETIRKRIENYFNFDNYSERKFEELSRNLIIRQEKSISINEALVLARFAPQDTYIVILKKNNKVCHIGKTERPLAYIERRQKKFGEDSAHFEIVDTDYVDDLIVSMRVLYDVELDKIHPSALNRKYSTIKQAVFAYKRSEGIPKKVIISAIQDKKLHTVTLENGEVLIDKIALHRALYQS